MHTLKENGTCYLNAEWLRFISLNESPVASDVASDKFGDPGS